MEYSYDSLGRTVGVCYNGVEEVRYVYSQNGNVSVARDLDNNREYRYYYDAAGRLLNERASVNTVNDYNRFYLYDEYGRLTEKKTYSEASKDIILDIERYTYNADGSVSSITAQSNGTIAYTYDEWGRLSSSTIQNSVGTEFFKYTYTYDDDAASARTTVKSVTLVNKPTASSETTYETTSYTYDACGNITKITYPDGKITQYVYDSSNQLIRENNQRLGYTYIFTYDASGNITKREEIKHTDSTSTSVTYSYANAGWGDQLTSYGGQSITYDGAGNPLSYYNGTSYTFTWQEGRQLASATAGGNTYTYKYDQNGIRVEKTENGLRHEYILEGTQIQRELIYTVSTGALWQDRIYSYDASGLPYAVRLMEYEDGVLNVSVTFYLKTNIHGDVIAACNAGGQELITYTYDAWGNVKETSLGETMNHIYAKYQPFRYRGRQGTVPCLLYRNIMVIQYI